MVVLAHKVDNIAFDWLAQRNRFGNVSCRASIRGARDGLLAGTVVVASAISASNTMSKDAAQQQTTTLWFFSSIRLVIISGIVSAWSKQRARKFASTCASNPEIVQSSHIVRGKRLPLPVRRGAQKPGCRAELLRQTSCAHALRQPSPASLAVLKAR